MGFKRDLVGYAVWREQSGGLKMCDQSASVKIKLKMKLCSV